MQGTNLNNCERDQAYKITDTVLLRISAVGLNKRRVNKNGIGIMKLKYIS